MRNRLSRKRFYETFSKRLQRRAIVGVAGVLLVMSAASVAVAGDDGSMLEDRVLATKVHLALLTELGPDTLKVDVGVESGQVMLSGEVKDRATKELAADIVDDVDGVQSVSNEIELEKPEGAPVSDAVEEAERTTNDSILESKVRLRLLSEIGTDALSIEIEASGGTVHLSGTTSSAADAERAVEVAQAVDGVDEVIGEVTSEK